MKKAGLGLLVGTMVLMTFSGCSQKIVGAWNIESYEVKEQNKAPLIVHNIGTLDFMKDGYGKKNIAYAIFQHQYASSSLFRWNVISKKVIKIDDESLDFNKGWLIIKDNKKVQVWKSVSSNDKSQTIRLVKL